MANFIVAQLLYLDAVDPNKVCFLVFHFVKFVFAYYVIIFVALNSSPFIVRQLWVLFFAFGSFCFIFCVISFFFFYKVLSFNTFQSNEKKKTIFMNFNSVSN